MVRSSQSAPSVESVPVALQLAVPTDGDTLITQDVEISANEAVPLLKASGQASVENQTSEIGIRLPSGIVQANDQDVSASPPDQKAIDKKAHKAGTSLPQRS